MSQDFPPRQPIRQSPRSSSGQTSPQSPNSVNSANTADNPAGQNMVNRPRSEAGSAKVLENGFTQPESMLLREAVGLAGMRWYDGPGLIMAKKEQFELTFRAGESTSTRWVVMAFPLYNMNDAHSVEICLHFLAEAHTMIHVLDFQYQVGINMETENLEFLMQLPLAGLSGAQMAGLINSFFEALTQSVMEELASILEEVDK